MNDRRNNQKTTQDRRTRYRETKIQRQQRGKEVESKDTKGLQHYPRHLRAPCGRSPHAAAARMRGRAQSPSPARSERPASRSQGTQTPGAAACEAQMTAGVGCDE